MTEPSDAELERIWLSDILPGMYPGVEPSPEPVTYFLGAQPGAGKTRGQMFIQRLCPGYLMPVVGDDFRQYHPDYDRLMETDPLSMPDVTARAAGAWTGMAVKYADGNRISCVIEGTWRNAATVLDEARRARSLGRGTRAVLLAVPPALSRLGILSRFYEDMRTEGSARWTPPTAHETTVGNLPRTVPQVAGSGLMDRLTVLERSGNVLYDGDDPARFVAVWQQGFDRTLTADEIGFAATTWECLVGLCEEFTPNNLEAHHVLELIRADIDRSAGAGEQPDQPMEPEEPTIPPPMPCQPSDPTWVCGI
ncbi:zeta toxin family protein [Pseudoscardovia radai]|uniref:zeta toxin family protein n=1 Tax=Pseudoscardovia radai TaxID=987066 RepID=UPI00399341DB